ncbi:cytochrome P450 [Rhizodiscina lignyota]|uniref:Cytochrome P450 n=1 Tax=Rhizodiscina lignyota TaxID=1504668 RepID=A0A9P4ICT3_9PEZI|nr:cytochrome P450 [Rhizodiscina lignyota]
MDNPIFNAASFAIVSLLILTCGTLLYALGRMIYNVFFHPLRSYPGPLLWKASSIPSNYAGWTGDQVISVRKLHLKYGDVVRVAPNELSYASEEALRDVMAHKPGHEEFPKDPKRQQKPPNGIANILGAERENHSRYRRLLAHAFSEKGLREQEPLIKQYVDLLVDRLDEMARSGEQTDMVEWYNLVTFDLIGDLAFGDPFNCLKDRRVHPWVYAVPKNVEYSLKNNILKSWGLEAFGRWLLPQDVVSGRKENYRYSEDKIERRIQYNAERGDFWDRVIAKSAGDNKSGQGMSKAEMLNNASVLVLGGSETTATVLSAATCLLLQHPDKLNKATQEIRSAFADTSEITLFSVSQLDYMLAVLDEAQRIYPAVPRPAVRITPNGGATVCGKFVPAGTTVGVHFMSAFGMSSNFHRPSEFIPERFLDEAKESGEFVNDNRGALQPFSLGTRNCIGRNLAYAEMRLILAKVLFHFDLSLDAERTGDWFDQKAWALWSKNPLYVKLSAKER